MIINKATDELPWHSYRKYNDNLNIIKVLHQDSTGGDLHKRATSNLDKVELLFKRRLSRRKHNFIISDGFRSYMYCYKLDKKNQPLLCQKITL